MTRLSAGFALSDKAEIKCRAVAHLPNNGNTYLRIIELDGNIYGQKKMQQENELWCLSSP